MTSSGEARDLGEKHSTRTDALREHSMLALFELSRELSVRLGTRRVIDLVLLNLMGRFGTLQSALWLAAEGGAFELQRAHGLPAAVSEALARGLQQGRELWSAEDPEPLRIAEAEDRVGPAARSAAEAGIELLAPLAAQGTILGFVAIGRRADDAEISRFEIEGLRSSLGMVAVAIENARLFHELQEGTQRLADAYRDLVELDRLKSEFIQNVNHELRTPLTVISGAIDCLLNPPDPNDARHRLHTAIQLQADKLSGMVQSLLELATMTGPADQVVVEDLDMTAMLEGYVTARATAVTAGGRRLLLAPSPASRARIARLRFTKVLDLLLDNAVKFTPAGTRIRVAATADPRDLRRVQVTFSDDGPGIPREELSRVFQPFFQIDGSTTRAAGGLGIGLAVARRLITAMGGEIHAESPAEGGTSFRMFLRAA